MSSPKIIGTIQLQPLVGAPKAENQDPTEILHAAGFQAVREAQALGQAGFDAVMLQNCGDFPYFHSQVPSETIACMAVIAAAVREAVRCQMGIQVLGNDGRSALAIASVIGCDWIRIHMTPDYAFVDKPLSDLALIFREREKFRSSVKILTDVHIKNIEKGAIHHLRYGPTERYSDGLILHGNESDFNSVKTQVPLYLELEDHANLDSLKEHAVKVDGFILGSILRKGNISGGALETKRLKEWVRELKKSHRKSSSTKQRGKSRKQ